MEIQVSSEYPVVCCGDLFFVIPVTLVLAEAGNGNPGFHFFIRGVSPPPDEVPSASSEQAFCFGKRTENHFRRARPLWGNFATTPNYMAAQLASLRQCSPERSNLVPWRSRAQGDQTNTGSTFRMKREVRLGAVPQCYSRHSRGCQRESSR